VEFQALSINVGILFIFSAVASTNSFEKIAASCLTLFEGG
jgi:hypothetical protein